MNNRLLKFSTRDSARSRRSSRNLRALFKKYFRLIFKNKLPSRFRKLSHRPRRNPGACSKAKLALIPSPSPPPHLALPPPVILSRISDYRPGFLEPIGFPCLSLISGPLNDSLHAIEKRIAGGDLPSLEELSDLQRRYPNCVRHKALTFFAHQLHKEGLSAFLRKLSQYSICVDAMLYNYARFWLVPLVYKQELSAFQRLRLVCHHWRDVVDANNLKLSAATPFSRAFILNDKNEWFIKKGLTDYCPQQKTQHTGFLLALDTFKESYEKAVSPYLTTNPEDRMYQSAQAVERAGKRLVHDARAFFSWFKRCSESSRPADEARSFLSCSSLLPEVEHDIINSFCPRYVHPKLNALSQRLPPCVFDPKR
jgi:hypothetical protein